MQSENKPSVIIFKAQPSDQRKVVAPKSGLPISRPNLVPDDITNNEFLNTLIDSSLPKNYNFEIHKTLWKIRQVQARRVLLQLPEGLLRFGTILVDIFSAYIYEYDSSLVEFITMGDLTYGACCIDDYLASSLSCDLVVHYAHSCLVPINELSSSVKYLYVFLDIKFDLEHIINCIKHNFNPIDHKIAVASTIQFVASTHEVAKILRQQEFIVKLPQSRPLSAGEVLGCTAPKLSEEINTIIFVCDGRFHLEALMIANPSIQAYRYDPYTRRLTRESYDFDQMREQRLSAINKGVEVLKEGGTFGIVLGTLGRQGSEKVYHKMVRHLVGYSNCNLVKLMMPEVLPMHLNQLESVDICVQVACPRLSIDWGTYYNKHLLNTYEFLQSLKRYLKFPEGACDLVVGNYPMDFYARNSSSDHTPNHDCKKNDICECSRFES